MIGIISLGVTLVIISKGIDLSSGSTLALAAVVAASFGQVGDWAAKMYPGIPELLERLRAHGFRVAVATGKPTPMACSILQRFDLERLFDCVIGCEYDGSRSTKAEVVAAVLAETHTPPEAALMVGDRKYDVTGAAACGVPCLGVYYGYAEPGELEAAGAVTTVQTVAELSERLLHWNEA